MALIGVGVVLLLVDLCLRIAGRRTITQRLSTRPILKWIVIALEMIGALGFPLHLLTFVN